MGTFGEIVYNNKTSLVSQQRVFSSANSSAQDAISQLGWSVIVHRDLQQALEPIQQQSRVITLVALIIIVVVGILGLVAAQRLAAPIVSLTDITQKVTDGELTIRAQITTQDEIGALASSFNRMTSQLQDTLGALERRVAERTADLELARLVSERRAQELQSISEISRTISTEQRLEILLPLVTRLVSERFDFYHTGIFFVEGTRQFAILQAANSEGGKRMLTRGHRLEIGTGLVGSVVQSGQPRIALDVGTDAVFFDNPDLPGTRSEMALPLNFRGETIGVLDVQSIQPGAFTADDANTLSILADQIAIAIENARLFGQTQRAREEAENLYNQFLRTEWKTFLRRDAKVGYRQTVSGGQALQKPIQREDIRQALQEGRVVIVEGSPENAKPSMAIPVKLRGQTIGVLNITSSKNRNWNQDEISLAQAISDRLALALDNARLLLESQRRAAKEAKIGEVTSKISGSINMRNVLQTAVEELGRALPGSEIMIQFQNSPEN
jgi:Signal transduction histidine kinase, nitrate/nitrite-specific